MKFITVLALAASMSSVFAGEQYGGITFHSSVEKNQVEIMKNDLRYLYQTPVTSADSEFLTSAKMQVGDGKNMHNWLLNRIRYIVGESFELSGDNIAVSISRSVFHKFPNTPLPDGFGVMALPQEIEKDVKTVMTNIGGALYLVGKKEGVPLGLKLDGENVYATSTRVGILQVGEGLFYEKFLINPDDVNAASNSISRLGTFFHEARHSDGTGKSTGFLHIKCPVGHAFEGYAACEISGNGSYSIGGLSERHLLANCTACSETEKVALAVKVADSFSRVIDLKKAQKRGALVNEINSLKEIIASYKNLIAINVSPEFNAKLEAELAKLEEQVKLLEAELASIDSTPTTKPADYDASPEGKFSEMDVKKSSKLMEKSLKK